MFLIIGLGNPGKEYEGTRHNVGFEVVEAFRTAHLALGPFGQWRRRLGTRADIAEGEVNGTRVILAKPLTYMNESGIAVVALVQQFTNHHSSFTILQDDLDLPLGTLRLSCGGSSGGHKGVQSVIDALTAAHTPTLSPSERGGEKPVPTEASGEGVGSSGADFLRLRIGIGPNTTPDGHRIPAEKFVLEKFRKEEHQLMDTAIQRAVEVIGVLLRDGLAAAQKFATKK